MGCSCHLGVLCLDLAAGSVCALCFLPSALRSLTTPVTGPTILPAERVQYIFKDIEDAEDIKSTETQKILRTLRTPRRPSGNTTRKPRRPQEHYITKPSQLESRGSETACVLYIHIRVMFIAAWEEKLIRSCRCYCCCCCCCCIERNSPRRGKRRCVERRDFASREVAFTDREREEEEAGTNYDFVYRV